MLNPQGAVFSDSSANEEESSTHSLDSLPIKEFLKVVGQRVRTQRAIMSMSRKRLAEVSGVSERYLAQLESGQGNMSIALLRNVTAAIGVTLGELLSAEMPEMENVSNEPVVPNVQTATMHTCNARTMQPMNVRDDVVKSEGFVTEVS